MMRALNYVYMVCGDDSWPMDSDRTCSDNNANAIIRLSRAVNGHAERADVTTIYPDGMNVCYGGISCSYESSCDEDDYCVAALSRDSSAHIGDCFDDDYPVKICCRHTQISQLWQVHCCLQFFLITARNLHNLIHLRPLRLRAVG